MAVAVAVIGKENSPLFVKTVSPSNELKFLYTIHTSLDVVEEKVSPANKSSETKFILIVETSHTTLRDNEIKQMFHKLHAAYADVVCNPFYVPGDQILSKAFEATVSSMMSGE
ncbi:trafficking protein particle complex subunit 2-like protein isoform X2 [Ornithodoros turicata]|uniref:trafficking protein particle complex subunit 2-like protein isoform X2 n=1 Tax=Ornithodoros turicata TaxID=34597 RepID=UPI0031396786